MTRNSYHKNLLASKGGSAHSKVSDITLLGIQSEKIEAEANSIIRY